jgi:tRNA pseudouridine13 synthase
MFDEFFCDVTFEQNQERVIEKYVGIEGYVTSKISGIGGIYKHSYKDFIVREITEDGEILEIREDDSIKSFSMESDDKYTTFNLIKINRETFEAIKLLSNALKIPMERIAYAGLKDKCSISVQKVSINGDFINALERIYLQDIHIRNIQPSRKSIKLGSNRGNYFVIVIRNVKEDPALEKSIKKIFQVLETEGFLNYYGLQRFGTFRPNSHLIGRYILEEKYKKACEEFVLTTYSSESNRTRNSRKSINNFNELSQEDIASFPNGLSYEKSIIEYLATNPDDYRGAINNLPNYIIRLLISAFQSYLFNKMLSLRLKKYQFPLQPKEGDMIAILDDDNGQPTQITYKYGNTYDKYLDEAIQLTRASIVIPIIGYDTNLKDFPLMDDLFQEILKEESISTTMFLNDYLKKFEFKGSFRSMTIKPTGLNLSSIEQDDLFNDKLKVKIEFSLPRGSYATMVLREIMK